VVCKLLNSHSKQTDGIRPFHITVCRQIQTKLMKLSDMIFFMFTYIMLCLDLTNIALLECEIYCKYVVHFDFNAWFAK